MHHEGLKEEEHQYLDCFSQVPMIIMKMMTIVVVVGAVIAAWLSRVATHSLVIHPTRCTNPVNYWRSLSIAVLVAV